MRAPDRASARSSRALVVLAPLGLLALAARSEPHARSDITAAELEAHLRWLAADERRGRDTGSPELEEAARYLAQALEAAGLEPAGDEGSFLQRVPLERVIQERPPELRLMDEAGAETLAAHGPDFRVVEGEGSTQVLRVVRVRESAEVPPVDPAVALYLAGTARDAARWLAEAGAGAGEGFGALVYRGSSREGARERGPSAGDLRVPRSAGGPPKLRVNAGLRERFERGELASMRLAQSVRRESVPTHNVLGLLRGRGSPERPELAREVVVFTAHYDHIGSAPPPEGASAEELAALDLVHNGADDDASGTAFVLELAEEFAAATPPARTLLFLLVTGEERGLIGTRHYLDHPALPLEQTVLNLNFEMVGRPDALAGGPGRLWLTGHERSNLFEAIQAHGLAIAADARPDQRFFERSDNYAFALRGIVAQTLSSYDLHQDYHRPSDEADLLDYAHMESGARAAYAIARLVADGAIDPAWLPGGRPAARSAARDAER